MANVASEAGAVSVDFAETGSGAVLAALIRNRTYSLT
jgi:hypothetical protein